MIIDNTIIKKKNTNNPSFKFSILIPTWNNLDYLKNCIKSIRKNSAYQHQIIVHINEGKDDTLNWVQSQTDIDYVFSPTNIGICYALNLCRELVTTSYIVFLNDDMYVCSNWDKYLMDEIVAIGHPYFFLSATLIEPTDTGNPCVIVKDYGRDIELFDEEKLLQEADQLIKDDWQGATWPPNIVHVSVWDLVGGYSVEFTPGFYSDPDFSMKLWQAGIRLFKGVGKSKAYHFGSRSTKRFAKPKGYYIFINKWGMSSSTFTKHYLRRGNKFTGLTAEVKLSATQRIKNFIKRLSAIIK
ncbi:glycosyl transferase family 2 [mine drainage metagenome]|uniref:Glycosyl transferase family 2 n=1 Tax=mine drainage metagenome TaxID=410659 RepID=A0A1J5RYB3_9ZZZZ